MKIRFSPQLVWHPNTLVLNDSGYIRMCQAVRNFHSSSDDRGFQKTTIRPLKKDKVLYYPLHKSRSYLWKNENLVFFFVNLLWSLILFPPHGKQRTNGPINGLWGKVLKVKDTLTKARETQREISCINKKTPEKIGTRTIFANIPSKAMIKTLVDWN